jgi:hypothetical protein
LLKIKLLIDNMKHAKFHGGCFKFCPLTIGRLLKHRQIMLFFYAHDHHTFFIYLVIYFLINHCPVVSKQPIYQTIKHGIIVQFSFRFKLNQNYAFTVEILTSFFFGSILLVIWSIQTNFEVPIYVLR